MSRSIRSRLKAWLSSCTPDNTILVAGSPRSGTTWLSEIIATLPGYKLFDEPLHLDAHPQARDCGFEWRTLIDPEASAPVKADYLRNVFSGKVSEGWKLKANTRVGRAFELVSNSNAVVKTVRSNRMLHWIHNTFALRDIVFIIRHPCAVVASRLSYDGAWEVERNEITFDDYCDSLSPSLVDTLPDVFPLRSEAEIWAMSWGLDHVVPFSLHANGQYPWTLVPYERLVTNGEGELQRLFSYLEADVPSAASAHLGSPSGSASEDLHATHADSQLSKWKRKLTSGQIDDILRIVHAFDFDMYTEDVIPDYDHLQRAQRSERNKVNRDC